MPENVKIPVATPQEVTLPISTSRKLFSSIEEKAKPPCKTACDNAAYFSPGQFKVYVCKRKTACGNTAYFCPDHL